MVVVVRGRVMNRVMHGFVVMHGFFVVYRMVCLSLGCQGGKQQRQTKESGHFHNVAFLMGAI
ncbi:hypothetical protein EDB95_2358 [Dinghuibacter silviterrae]|uniref:Uncharacterized protein n=2 Tax=Dinghuibacter silviterrae TaxID=1539049 RepID=A0A4R8DV31_9BACT|nr:hypothetical protein EDB95_2358 [Dinghuibacter silviterrae]